MKALKRNLSLAFGSPKYAVAPVAVGYAVSTLLIAFVLVASAGLSPVPALMAGILLGGLGVAISPVMWLIVWGTHRALGLMRKSDEERRALSGRVAEIEKKISKNK